LKLRPSEHEELRRQAAAFDTTVNELIRWRTLGGSPRESGPPPAGSRLALLVAERDDGTAVGNGVLFEAYEEDTGLKKSTFYKVKKAAVDAGLIRNVGTEKVPRYQVSAPPEHAPETDQDAEQPAQPEPGAK